MDSGPLGYQPSLANTSSEAGERISGVRWTEGSAGMHKKRDNDVKALVAWPIN